VDGSSSGPAVALGLRPRAMPSRQLDAVPLVRGRLVVRPSRPTSICRLSRAKGKPRDVIHSGGVEAGRGRRLPAAMLAVGHPGRGSRVLEYLASGKLRYVNLTAVFYVC